MFVASVTILTIAIVILKKGATKKNIINPSTPAKQQSEDIELSLQNAVYATISDVITNPSVENDFNTII